MLVVILVRQVGSKQYPCVYKGSRFIMLKIPKQVNLGIFTKFLTV